MNQKGFINILLMVIVVALVGTGIYVVSTRQIPPPVPAPSPTPSPTPTPTPTPAPDGAQTMSFGVSPESGSPPLRVIFGLFFKENPNNPIGFSAYSIDYGDGSHDSIQQSCREDTFLSTSAANCQVRAWHTYTSSGTFTATVQGIGAKGSSTTLGAVRITVGNSIPVTRTVGEKESSFLIQKINPDSVEGTWWEYQPVVRANDPGAPRTLRVGDDIGLGCAGVSEKLTRIDYPGQTVTFTKTWSKPPYGGCPICLSGETLIDTPSGLVPVKDVPVGMPIWTMDKSGDRISGIVTKTSNVPVPPTHQMVHLVFDDGRELFASPGHPTSDGRVVGDLVANDFYDGARVVVADRVTYGDTATYDILPSGETGFYWANGILLDSTLHEKSPKKLVVRQAHHNPKLVEGLKLSKFRISVPSFAPTPPRLRWASKASDGQAHLRWASSFTRELRRTGRRAGGIFGQTLVRDSSRDEMRPDYFKNRPTKNTSSMEVFLV